MSERRQYPRWEGPLLVDLEDSSGFIFEAVGLNLSTGGLCLIFPDIPNPLVGAIYGVSFQIPGMTHRAQNRIEIRWVDRIRTKICGVSFVQGLRAQEVYAIHELFKNA